MTVDQSVTAGMGSPDYEDIVRVIDLYIDGFDGRVDKFQECFHPDARMTVTDEAGTLHSVLISDCIEDWATSGHCERRILSVTQAGDVASVMVEMHDAPPTDTTHSWVDIHSLLRVNGEWKDMNKTATHGSRAGWAGWAYSDG